MALTRKMLREMGVEDEKAEEIIKAHVETVDAFKGSILDYQTKYANLEQEFGSFREGISKEKSLKAKKQAVTEMLRELHIPEDCVNPILQVTDFEKIELTENGSLLDESAVRSGIEALWSGFIPKRYLSGAETANPPTNASDRGYSREDIRRMSSQEINENYQAIKLSLGATND